MLSLLIVTKDAYEEVMKKVRDFNDIVDEIIIVDSTVGKDKKKIKSLASGKVKVYQTVPIGIADFYRVYGLKKCTQKYVLYLDSDEMLCDGFKHSLRKIIRLSNADGFLIERITYDSHGREKSYSDYQLRLFKRTKATYQGYPHEFHKIDGRVIKLKRDLYIYSIHSYDEASHKKIMENRNIPIARYTDRLTYNDLKELLKRRRVTEIFVPFITIFRDSKAEINKFDYRLLLWMRIFYRAINYLIDRRFPNLHQLAEMYKYDTMQIDEFFSVTDEERKLELEICKKIRVAGGPIRYLGFDKEKTVEGLSKKGYKKQGVDLLQTLLKERYQKQKK